MIYCQKTLTSEPFAEKNIMIFQEPMSALNPVYTVGEQISEALNHLTDLNAEKKKKFSNC